MGISTFNVSQEKTGNGALLLPGTSDLESGPPGATQLYKYENSHRQEIQIYAVYRIRVVVVNLHVFSF